MYLRRPMRCESTRRSRFWSALGSPTAATVVTVVAAAAMAAAEAAALATALAVARSAAVTAARCPPRLQSPSRPPHLFRPQQYQGSPTSDPSALRQRLIQQGILSIAHSSTRYRPTCRLYRSNEQSCKSRVFTFIEFYDLRAHTHSLSLPPSHFSIATFVSSCMPSVAPFAVVAVVDAVLAASCFCYQQ
ncbi:uncharacterized protein BJ171DRAFT_540938 [Polychytrium aggregatum]|uniref:uncharacterized protein n=1 Tax=Polychytrium aggregatum TaxID=110093 RepID=UPI0022FE2600|nr:uncharacterized protein BJ171DRAFT_540938 [Polychytrium aggregatum]KAI9190730.1 hypothetical protein BJ171DRAFT_540938 [Polychytrium aggregatum]